MEDNPIQPKTRKTKKENMDNNPIPTKTTKSRKEDKVDNILEKKNLYMDNSNNSNNSNKTSKSKKGQDSGNCFTLQIGFNNDGKDFKNLTDRISNLEKKFGVSGSMEQNPMPKTKQTKLKPLSADANTKTTRQMLDGTNTKQTKLKPLPADTNAKTTRQKSVTASGKRRQTN